MKHDAESSEVSRIQGATDSSEPIPLSQCIASINTPEGRKRLSDYLEATPFPHFEPVPGNTALLVRIDADGTRTIGRFVDRKFQAIDP